MGLFDFTKEIGKKLFNREEDAGKKIAEHILASNPGISDLTVMYKDGKVTLVGTTDNIEAAQKAVLMAGNVKGVSEVIVKISVTEAPDGSGGVQSVIEHEDVLAALEPENVEYYIIQSGDSLSKIAKKYYQNAMEYPRIFEANKEVIKDPDLIYPGQKIRIPLS